MNLYQVLNIEETNDVKVIKKAYSKLAKQYHPDKNNGDMIEKYEQITYAYNILKNDKSRKKYNMLNKNNKSKFHEILESLYDSNFNKEKFEENFINIIDRLNITEIFNFVTKNIIPKKEENDVICSDTDIDLWSESFGEYYDELPFIYQKYNNNTIILSLNITIDDLINNKIRKIKIKRNINGETITNTFKFFIKSNYVVFNEGGDILDTSGHLIIHLKLPENYTFENNIILYNYTISLYEYFYGINKELNIYNTNIKINNHVPYNDGNILYLSENKYVYAINFNYNYLYNSKNKEIMLNHFS